MTIVCRNDDAMYEALKADFLLNRKTAKADYYEVFFSANNGTYLVVL